MKVSEYLKGAVIKVFNNSYDDINGYKQWFDTKPDRLLRKKYIELEPSEILEIPYYGKTLRITVSEWADIELID